jgi:hypothetical protein
LSARMERRAGMRQPTQSRRPFAADRIHIVISVRMADQQGRRRHVDLSTFAKACTVFNQRHRTFAGITLFLELHVSILPNSLTYSA